MLSTLIYYDQGILQLDKIHYLVIRDDHIMLQMDDWHSTLILQDEVMWR